MPSTIEQAKEAILKHGGWASKHQIARELKISLDYAGLICRELQRKGEIDFSDGFFILTPLEVPKRKGSYKNKAEDEFVYKRGPTRDSTELLTELTSTKKDVTQEEGLKKLIIPSKRVGRKPKRLKERKRTKKSITEKRVTNPLSSILGISASLTRTLERAGYGTIESLAEAPINRLMDAAKLKLQMVARLINQARKIK